MAQFVKEFGVQAWEPVLDSHQPYKKKKAWLCQPVPPAQKDGRNRNRRNKDLGLIKD